MSIERVERALAAATPGPWASGGDEVYAGGQATYADICRMRGDEETFDANADLIAAAHNLLPRFIDVVRAAEAYGFCDATDKREACNQSDCKACRLRNALAALDTAIQEELP